MRSWWEQLLHNQVGLYIKRMLLFEPKVVVTSVPYHLGFEKETADRQQPRSRLDASPLSSGGGAST